MQKKNLSQLLIAFLSILFIIPQSGFAQKKKKQKGPDWKKFEEYVSNAMPEFNQEGLAIGIVKDGELVYSQGFGKRDMSSEAMVSPKSTFALASLSKAFTAASIGMLVDEGKINWSDKVTDHLSWFGLYDSYVTREMTIRDLLGHRSGLGTFDGDLLWYATDYSAEEIVRKIKLMPPKQGFRERFGYQNVMFMTAALIVEKHSGMSWFDFVQKRILNPLGMDASSVGTKGLNGSAELALPHIKGVSMPPQDFDNCPGAVGLNSSIEDLAKWVNFWLDKGVIGEETLLSEASINVMLSPHINTVAGAAGLRTGTHFKSYGLGWAMKDYRGKKEIYHSGGLPGYILNLAIIPEENLGVIVLTNGTSILPFALTNYALDLYLADQPIDWAGEYAGYAKMGDKMADQRREERHSQRLENTKPDLDPANYAGNYADKMYGPAKVWMAGDKLMLELTPTKELFSSEMEHWHHDTFRIKFKDPFLPEGFVTFNFDSNGNIESFEIDLPNPDFHFFNLEFERVPE